MPIRTNLNALMARRGVTLTELARRVGITLANLSNIKTNKARAIRFSTLDAICRELECRPGDLLDYVEGDKGPQLQKFAKMYPVKEQRHHSDSGLPGDYY